VLDQHVLKSASSADQGHVPLPRSADNLMGRLRIPVWAAGSNDYGRPRAGQPRGITDRVSGHDPNVDWNASILRGMSERVEGRAVKPVIGRQIDEHRDDDGPHR
jgi:hypothetical protein